MTTSASEVTERTERWALYVDIEGFSPIYSADETLAMHLLAALVEAIYRVGALAYPGERDRMFVHQTGDGFIIVSGSLSHDAVAPVAIAIVLMRSVLMAGGVAKCGVARGSFADIKGCYSDMVRSVLQPGGGMKIGSGFMRVFPVMGSALVRAHRLASQESGALLLIDSSMSKLSSGSFVVSKATGEFSVVDWVHSDAREISEIVNRSGIELATIRGIECRLRDYVSLHGKNLKASWQENTLGLNGCG